MKLGVNTTYCFGTVFCVIAVVLAQRETVKVFGEYLSGVAVLGRKTVIMFGRTSAVEYL